MRKASLLILLAVIAAALRGQTILLPFGSSWRYLDNGSNQGTAWQATSFSNATWKTSPSELGYGDGDEATVVSYGPNASAKYITTYFRTAFSVSNAALYSSYTLSYYLDDGMVVYCNGREVYRKNMPSGTISYTTLASSAASNDGKTVLSATLPASTFVTGSNEIAVEVHQRSASSSDLSFNVQVVGNAAEVQPAPTDGFKSIARLSSVSVSTNTGEKPQSKVWIHGGKHWAVLANSNGTYLYRLDGTSWTSVLRLSTRTSSKADCKVVGDVTHIFLYQGRSSQLVSVEYDATHVTYRLWSRRTSTVGISLDEGIETATIDMDSHGRMWLADAGTTSVYVRWSDAPYSTWSSRITVATGILDDDICAVVALPGKIGVFWSNQSTKRFGFKTHTDGASPTSWSGDEVPAAQSALNIGAGMADDHMNMAMASDGTLYCAVKTGYDKSGYPCIALLVRRTSGSWDKLYAVYDGGTRPIVLLNESIGKIWVVYTSSDSGGNILYKESATSSISFGPQHTLISSSSLNNATSTKDNFSSEVVIMASTSSKAESVLASDGSLTSTTLVAKASGESRPVASNLQSLTYTVFPSLVKQGERINIQANTADETEAVEIDNNGRILSMFRFTGQTSVYTDHLAAGAYYLIFRTSAGVKTQRFVVTR